MPKGTKLDKQNKVYSTKVQPWLRQLIPALRMTGGYASEREVLEDMAQAYAAKHPEKIEKAQAFMRDYLEQEIPEDVLIVRADFAAAEAQLLEAPAAAEPRVQTIRYFGKDTVHLYEADSKYGAACSLKGEVDPETANEGPASSVTCGKCRYCRKGALGL